MRVQAFLADSAEAVNGKIYALGAGWNMIIAPAFPATHPRMAVVMTIHVPYAATNQSHRVRVYLEDEDGRSIPLGMRPPEPDETGSAGVDVFTFTVNVGRPPHLVVGDEQIVPLTMTADQLTFPHPGMYNWVIDADGIEMIRLALRVGTGTA